MAKPTINLKGDAASSANLNGNEAQELMDQLGALLEGMDYPGGQNMEHTFKLGGQKRKVKFTLERRDETSCLVKVHSIQ